MYGHFSKNNIPPLRFLREFRVAKPDTFSEGQEIRADIFAAGEKVDITGTSKGRGFAGVVKKYGFRGGRASHGSMFHRKPASSGATDAARIFPGARRPGHMGNEQVTVKGLTVVRADAEKNMLVVKGAVPGPIGSLLYITMPDRPTIERGKGPLRHLHRIGEMTMTSIPVYTLAGQPAGEFEISRRRVRCRAQCGTRTPVGGGDAGQSTPGNSRYENTRRSAPLHAQDVEAERHRPCAPGDALRSALERRRRRHGPASA